MKSEEIRPNDGRKNNKRQKSIPLSNIERQERSNKPAVNSAKRSRRKAYAKKAIKNVFGSEVEMFETLAKQAKKGSYNHMKLLTDFAYEDDKNTGGSVNNAPVINFFNTDPNDVLREKTIDVEHKDVDDE